MGNLVKTSYKKEDIEILLNDLSGEMREVPTYDREKLIQLGVHYSKMLAKEDRPTKEYMELYYRVVKENGERVAYSVMKLGKMLYKEHGNKLVLISLARAGLSVGVLLKRYIEKAYGIDVPHYGVSIIRGRGIDKVALEYIYNKHRSSRVEHFRFIDGWTGKGMIQKELREDIDRLKKVDRKWENLREEICVLADPANITRYAATKEDLLIPHGCLNSIGSGLISRTILNHLIHPDLGEYHGAVYMEKFEDIDETNSYLDMISEYFNHYIKYTDYELGRENIVDGMEVVRDIQKRYKIVDINLIKPSIGETTRVLLRREPWKILLSNNIKDTPDEFQVRHIIELCKEKGIEYEWEDIGNYKACGLIKKLGDTDEQV